MRPTLALLAALALSCTPADAPTSIDACENMCRLGCSAGCDPYCAPTIDQLARDRVLVVDLRCVATASTLDEVDRCGEIGCTQ